MTIKCVCHGSPAAFQAEESKESDGIVVPVGGPHLAASGKAKWLSAPSLRGSLVAPIGQLHGAKLSSFQCQAHVGAWWHQ